MGGSSKKGGDDDNDIPQINPQQLIDQAIAANRVNVSTPFGSQTYNGNTLTTTLSPEMQALFAAQMGRAGGAAAQYQLPGQNADILNGLNTRLNQRYGIAMPPPPAGGSGSTPGTGGGSVPGTPPVTPPVTPPAGPPVIPPPTSGGSGSSGVGPGRDIGGDSCVVADSWMPGAIRAGESVMGHVFPVHSPEGGFHSSPLEYRGDLVLQPCVRLTIAGDKTIRCSKTTPFNFPDATRDLHEGHWAYAPDMLGQSVFVETAAGREARVVEKVEDIGEHWVVPLSFGGRSFPAGDDPDCLIYSHNIAKGTGWRYQSEGGGFDPNFMMDSPGASMGGTNVLSGAIDQSHATMAANNPTPLTAYSLPGGYLGSGSYEGMGSGLAAAGYPAPAASPPANGFGLPSGPVSMSPSFGLGSASGGAPGTVAPPALDLESPDLGPMPTLPGATAQNNNNFLDSKAARMAAMLLGGPGAAVILHGINKLRHRNDD